MAKRRQDQQLGRFLADVVRQQVRRQPALGQTCGWAQRRVAALHAAHQAVVQRTNLRGGGQVLNVNKCVNLSIRVAGCKAFGVS